MKTHMKNLLSGNSLGTVLFVKLHEQKCIILKEFDWQPLTIQTDNFIFRYLISFMSDDPDEMPHTDLH